MSFILAFVIGIFVKNATATADVDANVNAIIQSLMNLSNGLFLPNLPIILFDDLDLTINGHSFTIGPNTDLFNLIVELTKLKITIGQFIKDALIDGEKISTNIIHTETLEKLIENIIYCTIDNHKYVNMILLIWQILLKIIPTIENLPYFQFNLAEIAQSCARYKPEEEEEKESIRNKASNVFTIIRQDGKDPLLIDETLPIDKFLFEIQNLHGVTHEEFVWIISNNGKIINEKCLMKSFVVILQILEILQNSEILLK